MDWLITSFIVPIVPPPPPPPPSPQIIVMPVLYTWKYNTSINMFVLQYPHWYCNINSNKIRFWLIYVSSFFSLHKKNSKSGILFSMGILQKNVSEDYFMWIQKWVYIRFLGKERKFYKKIIFRFKMKINVLLCVKKKSNNYRFLGKQEKKHRWSYFRKKAIKHNLLR